MNDMPSIDVLTSQLQAHGQSQLLTFWNEITQEEQVNLVRQIAALDLDQIDRWVQDHVKVDSASPLPTHLEPAPVYPSKAQGPEQEATYREARALGRQSLKAGRVGAFVVAGGQGTRLGYDGPKGNFPASPIQKKSLFRLFAESILATGRRYGVTCPWYVMTSPLNHRQTCEIFEAESYFGLNRNDVVIFQQGTVPNFDFEGRILLADRATLAHSPDGHGGSLKALHDSGALDDMRQRGVDVVSYWQVDNPLINIFDPLFIGLHLMAEADMSSKALKKTGPLEKVGNFCLADGKITVVEYSDLPDEQAHRTHADGSRVFDMGSIGIHLINRGFVEELNQGGFSLPMHRAVKKIPHITAQGVHVDPTEPNGVKLEMFVFDALPLAKHSIILETERAEEFGPIKNATGVDSAESSRRMMIERAASWLENAGIQVPRDGDGRVDCVLEIAPSFALCAEDVGQRIAEVPPLQATGTYYLAG
jgi:UDP-N-acetylglucosamine/UDP-N-acetylgalactosamine diphosphorylase